MGPLQVIQAMATPAIFFSGGGLLLLSLNTRLIAIFARVRRFHEQGPSPEHSRLLDALHHRARMVRNAFAATIIGVVCALATSLMMALGTIWPGFDRAGVATMAVGLIALAGGLVFYLLEVIAALPTLEMSRNNQ